MITISREQLELVRPMRQPGYVEAVLACSIESGGFLEISEDDYVRIARAFAKPDWVDKAKSLSDALKTWTKAGFPATSEDVLLERKKICEACEFFKPSRFWLSASCRKCGCKGIKLYMETSTCPDGKW